MLLTCLLRFVPVFHIFAYVPLVCFLGFPLFFWVVSAFHCSYWAATPSTGNNSNQSVSEHWVDVACSHRVVFKPFWFLVAEVLSVLPAIRIQCGISPLGPYCEVWNQKYQFTNPDIIFCSMRCFLDWLRGYCHVGSVTFCWYNCVIHWYWRFPNFELRISRAFIRLVWDLLSSLTPASPTTCPPPCRPKICFFAGWVGERCSFMFFSRVGWCYRCVGVGSSASWPVCFRTAWMYK